MSIFDRCELTAGSATETAKIGFSLASSLYRKPLSMFLVGELGAGKTVFVQGLAQGLGIEGNVVSPSYALEKRYGDILCHLDLFRMERKDAQDIVDHSADFPGLQVIEWGDRATQEADIVIRIDLPSLLKEKRHITIEFNDIQIPSKQKIQSWCKEVGLPPHIARHGEVVAQICDKCADVLLRQNRVVRKRALHGAALAHDLLRFVDFKTPEGDPSLSVPTENQVALWKRIKEKYPPPHEAAGEQFLIDKGYPEIGRIIRTHRGWSPLPAEPEPETMEQFVLAYADKRATFEKVVTLDKRFNDFAERYGNGKETAHARAWREEMKRIETMLFPEGAPL